MKYFNIVIFLILGALVYGIYFFMYRKTDLMIGDKAPDIRSTTIDGKMINLSQFQGKLVLLDFWGSWCTPCRKANPELAKLYNEFHDTLHSNFEIVSIAIDDDTTTLRQAIAQDGLAWPYQIMEPKSGGPATLDYKIKTIPASYLINDQQMIIKVNPGIEELRDILNKFVAVHYSKIKADSTGRK